MQRKNVYDSRLTLKELKSLITDENVNDRSYGGLAGTVLHTSAIEAVDRQKRLEICMQHHADLNIKSLHPDDPFQNTVLHLLIANEAYEDALAFIQLAKKYHLMLDFNVVDSQSKTPLILACKMRQAGTALAILNEKRTGANVDVIFADVAGNTALHYACALGMTDVVRQLVALGADISKENHKGRTPIDMTRTTALGLKEIFSAVDIDYERDENATYNSFIDQYFQRFIDLGERKIITISAKKSNKSALQSALKQNLIDTGKYLREHVTASLSPLEKRKILHSIDPFSGRSIVEGCLAQQKEVLEIMLGFRANAGYVFRSAASADEVKEMELILKHQPEILNACGKPSGRSALHYAADKNSVEVCKFLIAQRADANLLDEAGNTPLHLACAKGNIKIVKLLLELDCDVEQKNNAGQTAWQLVQAIFSQSSLNNDTKVEMEKLFMAKREKVSAVIPQSAAGDCAGTIFTMQ